MDKPCILSNEGLSHGYPRRNINDEYVRLNRYVLEQKLGRPIREGYMACHSCNNKGCIEPEHIYEGSRTDNLWDLIRIGNAKFFGNHRHNKEKTHCPKGHEYTPENTRYNHRGKHRNCRTCDRERNKVNNERIRNFLIRKAKELKDARA